MSYVDWLWFSVFGAASARALVVGTFVAGWIAGACVGGLLARWRVRE
jgi:hypothetical protein